MRTATLISALVLLAPPIAAAAEPNYNRSSCLTVADNNREGTSPGVWVRNTCNVPIEFVFCTSGSAKDYFNCAPKPSDPRFYQQGESGIGPGGEEPMPTSSQNQLLFFGCDWSGAGGHYPLPKITSPTNPPQGYCDSKGVKPQETKRGRHPGDEALEAMLDDEFSKSPQVKAPPAPTAPANAFPSRGAGPGAGDCAAIVDEFKRSMYAQIANKASIPLCEARRQQLDMERDALARARASTCPEQADMFEQALRVDVPDANAVCGGQFRNYLDAPIN